MRYELMNRIHGHKVICDSDASKDHYLNSCKRGKDGKPVWFVSRTLGEEVKKPQFTVEQLKAMLAEAESTPVVLESEPARRGRPKKEVEDNA